MDNAVRTRQRMPAMCVPVTAALYIASEGVDPKGTDTSVKQSGPSSMSRSPTSSTLASAAGGVSSKGTARRSQQTWRALLDFFSTVDAC
jgi:hypothetical protein